MNVRFSNLAEEDLDGILRWIAEDNPARALSFVGEMAGRCALLAEYPLRFPEVRRVGLRSIRKLAHKGYLIFYKVDSRGVEIARVVHGSRDWAAMFHDELDEDR